MDAADLLMCIERHATSKLAPDTDLVRIASLGFRGEALASIGSVSRLTITTRTASARHGLALDVEAGRIGVPRPASARQGTRVDVRDLFFSTPARLAFLKSERAETAAVIEQFDRLALSRPDIHFRLTIDGELRRQHEVATHPGDRLRDRVAAVLGSAFLTNALSVRVERDGLELNAFLGLPTDARSARKPFHNVVNGRPVRDRLIETALRVGYGDTLAKNRLPGAVIMVRLDPDRVDVNVHPAKTELRFREPDLVRSVVIGTIRHHLGQAGVRTAHSLGTATAAAFASAQPVSQQHGSSSFGPALHGKSSLHEAAVAFQLQERFDTGHPAGRNDHTQEPLKPDENYPLGAARAQLFDAYVLAECRDGFVLVDQHAAHERIVYERLKAELGKGGVVRQGLLMPVVVDLAEDAIDLLMQASYELRRLGLVVERFGARAIIILESPALLGSADLSGLIEDLVVDLRDVDTPVALLRSLEKVAATMACHGSVRAGRRLSLPEMDALLRQIEETPNGSSCNHGRPTSIALDRVQLDRLFGR